MRAFKSRIGQVVSWKEPKGCVYFVTSEKGPHENSPRKYTARVMDPDGNIDSVGAFNVHTKAQAERLAREAADHGFTAHELSKGGIAVSCIGYAKEAWEKADGSITPEVETHRRNAENWAKEAGWKIEWTSITPSIHRNGREWMLSQIIRYLD